MPTIQTIAPIPLARDARSGATITLDLSLPRAIFVTGKRGSGKTTTLHTIATHAAQAGATVIAIDPIGVLISLVRATHSTSDISPQSPSPTASHLRQQRTAPGNASPSPSILSIPGNASPSSSRLLLNPSDLSTDAWLALFDLSISKPGGILLSRALRHLRRTTPQYLIPDLMVLPLHTVDNSSNLSERFQRLKTQHFHHQQTQRWRLSFAVLSFCPAFSATTRASPAPPATDS